MADDLVLHEEPEEEQGADGHGEAEAMPAAGGGAGQGGSVAKAAQDAAGGEAAEDDEDADALPALDDRASAASKARGRRLSEQQAPGSAMAPRASETAGQLGEAEEEEEETAPLRETAAALPRRKHRMSRLSMGLMSHGGSHTSLLNGRPSMAGSIGGASNGAGPRFSMAAADRQAAPSSNASATASRKASAQGRHSAGGSAPSSRRTSSALSKSPAPAGGTAADADRYTDLSLEELERLLTQQEIDNAMLMRETHCLERFWGRQEQNTDELNEEPSSLHPNKESGGRSHRRRSQTSKSNITSSSNAPQTLTDAQKGDIAQRDLEFLQANFKRFCKDSDRIVNSLMANIEEADVRLAELPKLEAMLVSDVVEPGKDSRSGKPETEDLQRFYSTRIRHCKTMIDKLDMKSTAMRAKQWREEEQMRSKEDVGGALCKVDFEQLKIENTRFAEVMDERNHELLNLKVLVGNTNNQLMSLKKRLNSLGAEEQQLKREIGQRDTLLKKLETELERVGGQTSKLQGSTSEIKRELSEYRPPDIMLLIKEQAVVPELKKTVKTLERKVELAKLEFTRTQRLAKSFGSQ